MYKNHEVISNKVQIIEEKCVNICLPGARTGVR